MGDSLPTELGYLNWAATHFGPAERYWTARRVELDATAWRALAEVHETICRREDALPIAQWLAAPCGGAGGDVQRRVSALMRLLRRLGRAGVKPFETPVLRLPRVEQSPPKGDGPALPARLRYVVGRAMQLGIKPRWQELADFIDGISERTFNALALTADRMRRRGDDRLLRRWLTAQPAARTRATRLARSFLHVLDALEIF